MKLIPYLYFGGDCEAALNFYKDILQADVGRIVRYGEQGMGGDDFKDKILHASLTFGDNAIMMSDCMPGYHLVQGTNSSLSVSADNEEQARRIFGLFTDGGTITVAMEVQFWGDLFGEVVDKFSNKWMVNCSMQ